MLKVIQTLLYSIPCSHLGLHTPDFGVLNTFIASIKNILYSRVQSRLSFPAGLIQLDYVVYIILMARLWHVILCCLPHFASKIQHLLAYANISLHCQVVFLSFARYYLVHIQQRPSD